MPAKLFAPIHRVYSSSKNGCRVNSRARRGMRKRRTRKVLSAECRVPRERMEELLGTRHSGLSTLLDRQQLRDRLDQARRLDGLADVGIRAEGQAALGDLLGTFRGD